MRFLDLTNGRFGRLTAIERVPTDSPGTGWLCRCDCGNYVTVQMGHLRSGHTRSCGCLYEDNSEGGRVVRERAAKKHINTRYERLLIVQYIPSSADKGAKAICLCDCGNTVVVAISSLTSRRTRSCGCLSIESATTHGMHGTPEYNVWCGIKSRCLNPNNQAYSRYGGRGIAICLGWLSFEGYFGDTGLRPSPELTIERKDNNGGYWCGHCEECAANGRPKNWKWATPKEQANNRRNTPEWKRSAAEGSI